MASALKFEEQKQEIDYYRSLAVTAIKSGNYPGVSEMAALNIMLSAKDLGVSPFKALNGGFYIVNGKISMSTALMSDRIRSAGHSIIIPEWTKEKCIVIGKRKDNGDSVRIEFSMEDAQNAGLLTSGMWKKYPKNMLYNRAMSMLARVLFPDVIGNCYSEDEREELGSPLKKNYQATQEQPVNQTITEAVVLERPADLSEIAHLLKDNIDIPDADFLEEYLSFAEKKVPRPLDEVADTWLQAPEKFLSAYKQWVSKRNVEHTNDKKTEKE